MNNTSSPPPLALIAGPTASGKSEAAMRLAAQFGGVIVNADASQVYGDLRVLTARPSQADEARVPHRLFGHVDGADSLYSAARWADDAKRAIADVHAAGALPILVGGSGLYLRTLIDGIAPVPAIDPAIRAAVRALPVDEAYAALAEADPVAAAGLAPADTTRVARALEVMRSTGRPLARWQAERAGGIGAAVSLTAAVLLPPRDALFAAIDSRTAAMMDSGAIDEVAALLARAELPRDAPLRRAIGVPAIAALLAGHEDRPATVARIALETRQYAKRQYTWFRNQPPSSWYRANDSDYLSSFVETKLRAEGLTRSF